MFSGPAENDAGPSPAKARISMTPGCPLWVGSRRLFGQPSCPLSATNRLSHSQECHERRERT